MVDAVALLCIDNWITGRNISSLPDTEPCTFEETPEATHQHADIDWRRPVVNKL